MTIVTTEIKKGNKVIGVELRIADESRPADEQVKLLSTIPGISPKVAADLLSSERRGYGSMRRLAEELEKVTKRNPYLRTGNVGRVKTSRLIEVFKFSKSLTPPKIEGMTEKEVIELSIRIGKLLRED